MTHSELVAIAVKWLKRPHSKGGAGCQFAASELPTGYVGEIPDAYGVKLGGVGEGSIVVEVKVSRSDFLSDHKKPHRALRGVGDWRYYMAPSGLISESELPAGWGLVEVNARGHIKVTAGALSGIADAGYELSLSRFESWACDCNMQKERFMLAKLLTRIADPEQANRWICEANTRAARSQADAEKWRDANTKLRSERFYMVRAAEVAGIDLNQITQDFIKSEDEKGLTHATKRATKRPSAI